MPDPGEAHLHSTPGPYDVILLDVGNVLLYDFPVEAAYSYFLYRELCGAISGFSATPSELLWAAKTGAAFLPEERQPIWDAAVACAWASVLDSWQALSIPIPHALDALSQMGCRIAIVANQPPSAGRVLRALGVTSFVERVFLDSEVGISKPDPELYRYVAKTLRVAPTAALMIGDRFDNDIQPARDAGMAVGWIRELPLSDQHRISGVPEGWLLQYLQTRVELQTRLDARHGDWWNRTPPDFTFDTLADVSQAIAHGGLKCASRT